MLENNLETCTVDGEHASVVYLPSRLTATQLADNDPADGTPDKAAQTVEALDSAWNYYHEVLGYTGPSSGRVWWGWNVIDLVNDRAASLPGGVIVAPDTNDVSYLVAHPFLPRSHRDGRAFGEYPAIPMVRPRGKTG